MLSLGRATVPSSTPFQPGDQLVVQIAYVQVPSHPSLREIIDINDLKYRPSDQETAWRHSPEAPDSIPVVVLGLNGRQVPPIVTPLVFID